MYKYLLCQRYLRTRFIALASIISVMLGVATMIVVNSVMSGFSHQMRDRIHGLLADVVVESHSLDGVTDPDMLMRMAREVSDDQIEAITPTDDIVFRDTLNKTLSTLFPSKTGSSGTLGRAELYCIATGVVSQP